MLKSKKSTFILALIMAVALWAYVLGEVDPERTVTIRNIPITLTNQSALENSNLVVTEMDQTAVSITFTANRSIANKISGDDFHVSASLSGVSVGDNVIELTLSRPSGIKVESMSSEFINIKTEQQLTAEKTIEVELLNETDDDTEPKIIKLSEETVNVTGPLSKIREVERVVAPVDSSRIGTDPTSISVELVARDKNGNDVEGVTLETTNVSVTAVIKNTKTVKLIIPVIGQESGSITRKTEVPKEITIKGSQEDLEEINSITCETVDLSEIYESTEITLVPILPDGVEPAIKSQNLIIEVACYNSGAGEFQFDETNIDVIGVGEGRSVIIHEVDIAVTVKGLQTVINSLQPEDLQLTADVEGLKDGTHTVDLKIDTLLDGIDLVEANPSQVVIEVKTED